MSLKHLKVGDTVIIHRYNHGASPQKVEAVGRKYLTVGKFKYDRETGHWNDKNFSYRRTAMTVERHEYQLRRNDLLRAVEDFAGSLRRNWEGHTTLTDEEMVALTERLHVLSLRMDTSRATKARTA